MEITLLVSSILLWIVVLCNVLLTLALVRRLNRMGTTQPAETGLKAGELAPHFIAQNLQGITKTLADYARRSIAFVFISTTCQPCLERLPMLEKIGPEARTRGVELVLVSGDGLEATQELREKMNLQLPVLIAPRHDNPFFSDYKVVSTPTFCLIGPDGSVQKASFLGQTFEDWKLLAEDRKPAKHQAVLTGD